MVFFIQKLKLVIAAIVISNVFYTPLIAQEMKWGIGLTLNSNAFFHSNNSLYANTMFKPMISNTLGINLKREIASNGRFKTQILLHILKKSVTLGFREKSGARTLRQTINYQFFSADLGVNVLYENPDWRYRLRPFVGLSFSSAYFVNAMYREGSTFTDGFTWYGMEANTPDEIHKWVFYPCVNLGVSKPFTFTNGGNYWEWTLSTQLSPVQSFQNLQVPPPNGDLQLLRGYFHHLTFALNRFF